MKATKNLLLTTPIEEFFLYIKRLTNKNKRVRDLSPFGVKFFKVFLKSKGKYKKPKEKAYLRPYKSEGDKISSWSCCAWDATNKDSLKLAVIEFWNILKVINKETTPRNTPYFVDFLKKLEYLAVNALHI